MKFTKRFYLLIITTLLTLTQVGAFEAGTYYLQTGSGTYIDALAVNSSNPGAKFQTESATAFRFTEVSGGYTIQNSANDNYLLYSTANNWDTKMSASVSETNYAGVWAVTENSDGLISISRLFNATTYYLGNGNTNSGTGVFSGQNSAVWYTLVTDDPFRPFDADKYYTIKTGNPESYFVCSDNATVLGRSAAAPTYENLDTYLWKIVGNNQDGYTLQNKATGLYAQNPATISDHQQIRMTADGNSASRFKFVGGLFQLASNAGWYLAAYSSGDNFISIHNNAAYSGSKITKLPMVKVAEKSVDANVYDGSASVGLLNAANYITNVDGNGNRKYPYVPAGKAWQMVMDVTHDSGQKASFNQFGSCIISSEGDPINTFYWNNFQVFEHAAPRKTLNFKSNKGDGMDHIIAQGHQVLTDAGYEDYRVIVRYDGGNVYLIRTIILNSDGSIKTDSEGKEMIFNNVWFAARVQNDITVMTSAIPAGTHLKNLEISIAEESNLMEGVDYAIQNIKTKDYLIGANYSDGATWYGQNAGDAAHYQIEWTNNNDLTYTDTDGGLHQSFYIKLIDNEGNTKYLGPNNTNVDTKTNALAYIYSNNSKKVQPITAKETLGDTWKITAYDADTWLWDFFANFYVEVAGNNNGGLNYMHAGEKQTATNGQYIMLPSGVNVNQLANSSQAGYMAAISKQDIRLKVQYTPLDNTFYNITDKSNSTTTLYYWYRNRREGATLVTYSTGNVEAWGEKGDCSKFTIAKAASIPVKFNQNTAGDNPDNKYYGTIFSPNALVLPEGVTAYAAKDNGATMRMIEIAGGGNILPANTAAILQCDEYTALLDITLNTNDNSTLDTNITNNLDGTFITFANPKDGTYYTLSGKNGIGFYKYTGANLNAFKAFCHSGSSTARMAFTFDEATDIDNLQTEAENKDAVIYDLFGHRITSTTKGIYIINGKKVLK